MLARHVVCNTSEVFESDVSLCISHAVIAISIDSITQLVGTAVRSESSVNATLTLAVFGFGNRNTVRLHELDREMRMLAEERTHK